MIFISLTISNLRQKQNVHIPDAIHGHDVKKCCWILVKSKHECRHEYNEGYCCKSDAYLLFLFWNLVQYVLVRRLNDILPGWRIQWIVWFVNYGGLGGFFRSPIIVWLGIFSIKAVSCWWQRMIFARWLHNEII